MSLSCDMTMISFVIYGVVSKTLAHRPREKAHARGVFQESRVDILGWHSFPVDEVVSICNGSRHFPRIVKGVVKSVARNLPQNSPLPLRKRPPPPTPIEIKKRA